MFKSTTDKDGNDVLMRSTDSGCDWDSVWTSPVTDTGYPYHSAPSIGEVVFPPSGPTDRVYATLSVRQDSWFPPSGEPVPDQNGAIWSPVMVSDKGGASGTFKPLGGPDLSLDEVTAGGLMEGGPILRIAPSDPKTMYLQVCGNLRHLPIGLFVTHDAGNTWESLKDDVAWAEHWATLGPGTTGYNFPIDMLVDPSNAGKLWAWEPGTALDRLDNEALRSTDGGRTWAPAKIGAPYDLEVVGGSGASTKMLAVGPYRGSSTPYIEYTEDDGDTWRPVPVPAYGLGLAQAGGSIYLATYPGDHAPDTVTYYRQTPGSSNWKKVADSVPLLLSFKPEDVWLRWLTSGSGQVLWSAPDPSKGTPLFLWQAKK